MERADKVCIFSTLQNFRLKFFVYSQQVKNNYDMRYFPIVILALCLLSACRESADERCIREAEAVNRQCPKIIDPCTQLDSIRFTTHDRTFTYFYSLKGEADSTLRATIADGDYKQQVLRNIVNTADMRYYMEQNVSFEYRYVSQESGLSLGVIRITPDEYGRP